MSTPEPLGIFVSETIETDDGLVGAPLPKGMKVLVQWARKNPRGWEETDARNWARLPKRAVPWRGQLGAQDDSPGHVRNVSVQGITCEGFDHISVEPITIGNDEGVRLTTWNDDPEDYPIGERNAIVWTILPLAPDPKLGMALNTVQSCVRYCEGARYQRLLANTPQNTTVRPWAEFVEPDEQITRHGIWLPNDKLVEHITRAPQSEFGWRHWCEHLPDSECSRDAKGRRVLREQRAQGRWRKAAHTITYYQRDTAQAWGGISAVNENALSTSTAAANTQSVTLNSNTNVQCWSFLTDAGQPNSADWPSGVYHAQFDCTAASSGVTYGLSSFYKVLADASTQSLAAGVSNGNGDGNDFAGTGLKLTTSDSGDPAAGLSSDRFGISNVNASGDSHGDAITLELNTSDSYADGPWTAGGSDPAPSVSDTVTVSESPTVLIPYLVPSKSETVTVTDAPTTNLRSFISVGDGVTVGDEASAVIVTIVNASDEVTVSESVNVTLTSFISKAETVTVTDVPTVLIPYLVPSVSDTITVSDAPTVRMTSFISVSDAVTVSETLNLFIANHVLSVSDQVTVSDAPNVNLLSFINVSDSITVSDAPNASIISFVTPSPSVSDSISVSDTITISISGDDVLVVTTTVETEPRPLTFIERLELHLQQEHMIQTTIDRTVEDHQGQTVISGLTSSLERRLGNDETTGTATTRREKSHGRLLGLDRRLGQD